MNPKIKKIVFFIGSLFIAVLFLSSFYGNGSVMNSNTNNTKPKNVTIIPKPAYGFVNATVENYGTSAAITLLNTSFDNLTNNILVNMEGNGSISTYNQIQNKFNVYLNNINSYDLQKTLSDTIGSNSFILTAKEFVKLHNTAKLYVENRSVAVYLGSGVYSFTSNALVPINSTIRLYLSTILQFYNGTYSIYGNATLRSV